MWWQTSNNPPFLRVRVGECCVFTFFYVSFVHRVTANPSEWVIRASECCQQRMRRRGRNWFSSVLSFDELHKLHMQCNGGQNWFLPQLTFCTSGSGRSLLYGKSKHGITMVGRGALWCLLPVSHLVQLQRQISMGRRGEGWSLVMCGPDSSGALSPSLIIYPPSTSLSLDKNGVQGNPVNFPKLSGNFNNEKSQFRGFTGACRWWWCF